ncbi:MAG: aldo/keto reductase [Defluviitaleaceae bacterium]|nr:aldo/keto reductase [Defluviitaleaceae bacterium]
MEYVKLGNTGLDVSKICLGCMSFGDGNWIHKWVLNEQESEKVIKRALELGINFFDTANIYSFGTSEEYLGKALKKYAKREDVVIATKVNGAMRQGPNSVGLSRKAIFTEVDNSLKRLGTDYIDLYIIHRFDNNTPIEETLDALDRLVKLGKVRYLGASSMYAWQFLKMLNISEKNGWTKFISMQNHYNLIYREEEREMIPLCIDQKIAITPYSPLAAGRLSRSPRTESDRKNTDKLAKLKYDETIDIDRLVIDRLFEIAKNKNVSAANIALAWLFNKQSVISPIIGATKIHQLEDLVLSIDIKLTEYEMGYLEEHYVPHKIVGHK